MNSKTVKASSSRRGLRGAVLGATMVAALLTATACQPSEGDDKAAASPTATPSGSASAGGRTSESTEPSGDSGTGSDSTTGAGAGDGGETGGGNGTAYADCEVAGLNTAVELQDGSGETPATSC